MEIKSGIRVVSTDLSKASVQDTKSTTTKRLVAAQDTFEDASRKSHYFNGRLLTADSLSREQNSSRNKTPAPGALFQGVFLQRGRVQTDSDFQENDTLALRFILAAGIHIRKKDD